MGQSHSVTMADYGQLLGKGCRRATKNPVFRFPFLNPDISDAEARLAGTCLEQDRGSQNDSRLKI